MPVKSCQRSAFSLSIDVFSVNTGTNPTKTIDRHTGRVRLRRTRSGIQEVLVSSGFPFDFAQGGEPVEPRISAYGVFRNDVLI